MTKPCIWRQKETGKWYCQIPHYEGIKSKLKHFKAIKLISDGHYLIYEGKKKKLGELLRLVQEVVKKGGISGKIVDYSLLNYTMVIYLKQAYKNRLKRLFFKHLVVENELRPGYYCTYYPKAKVCDPSIEYKGLFRDNFEVVGRWKDDGKGGQVISLN